VSNLSVIRISACALPALALLAGAACHDAQPRSVRTDTSAARAASSTEIEPGPADVVRRYYAAIGNGEYDSAYVSWEGAGKASGQTPAQFANGFRETVRAFVSIGDSVTIEGAAGSQYATIPVTIDAVLRSGAAQRFTGTYTLRRAMADGATAEQRRWRIYSAHLENADRNRSRTPD
jgi:hypothetical protein